jgi:hypothetical protein
MSWILSRRQALLGVIRCIEEWVQNDMKAMLVNSRMLDGNSTDQA